VQQLGLPSVSSDVVGFATSRRRLHDSVYCGWPGLFSSSIWCCASQFGSFLQPFVIMREPFASSARSWVAHHRDRAEHLA